MAQPNRLLPILFTLNNTDATRDTVVLVFSFFHILLLTEESSADSLLKSIDIFTFEDFLLLHNRIVNARNKVVGMNEKHVIVFYGVLFMIVKMLNTVTEVNILNKNEEKMNNFFSPENMVNFIKVVNKFIGELKGDYNKNHYIARSIAKINTF